MLESGMVKIVDYKPIYKEAFKELNEEWIKKFFKMEESDYQALDNPQEYIIEKGGYILVALFNNEPIGVCALIKTNHQGFDFELAKMAVSPICHGKGVGYKLGKAVIEKAKVLNAKVIFLESNTILKSALHLYRKLGFVEVPNHNSPYERSNIKMELVLNS